MARTPAALGDINDVYIDETSQTGHRYLAVGGIVIHAPQAAALEVALQAARLPELPQGEIGWTKVSRTKFAAYKRFADAFFDNPQRFGPFEFHCLVVDTHKLNDRRHNGGSREIGFNKEIYQICQKFARLHRQRLLHIYPDRRDTKHSPEELRLILNRGIRKQGDPRDWPFRRVHFRDSSKSQVLQLVDVLLGSVAFQLNGHHAKPDASLAKCALAQHILGRARVADVMRGTGVSGKFTIWHRELK